MMDETDGRLYPITHTRRLVSGMILVDWSGPNGSLVSGINTCESRRGSGHDGLGSSLFARLGERTPFAVFPPLHLYLSTIPLYI